MSESGACNAQPSGMKVRCLLDEGHAGPHRWWDAESIISWVPHSETWRKDPGSAYIVVADAEPQRQGRYR